MSAIQNNNSAPIGLFRRQRTALDFIGKGDVVDRLAPSIGDL